MQSVEAMGLWKTTVRATLCRWVQWAWWAREDLNLGPLPCQGSALTPELRAPALHRILRNGPHPRQGRQGTHACHRKECLTRRPLAYNDDADGAN